LYLLKRLKSSTSLKRKYSQISRINKRILFNISANIVCILQLFSHQGYISYGAGKRTKNGQTIASIVDNTVQHDKGTQNINLISGIGILVDNISCHMNF